MEINMSEETRIDEHGAQAFAAMGFTGELPAGLIDTYKKLKFCKDRIQPGRLEPDMLALCVILSGTAGVLSSAVASKSADEASPAVKENTGEKSESTVVETDPKYKVGDSLVLVIGGKETLASVAEGEVAEGNIAVVIDGDEGGQVRQVPLSAIKTD
jgi:hypothetical protein